MPTDNDEDVHVRELRRLFDLCDEDNDGYLDGRGLERLCGELRLDEHKLFIADRLLPRSTGRISFHTFKTKFIQLLPEIIDFASLAAESGSTSNAQQRQAKMSAGQELRYAVHNGVNGGESLTPSANVNSRVANRRRRRESSANGANRSTTNKGSMMNAKPGSNEQSDQDTFNDVLSEFSDDDRRRTERRRKQRSRASLCSETATSASTSPQPAAADSAAAAGSSTAENQQGCGISAADIDRILNGLGLADCGYLGRYEFRILCQHLGLNALTSTELSDLFNQLDKDGDGRIAVDDFLTTGAPLQAAEQLEDNAQDANLLPSRRDEMGDDNMSHGGGDRRQFLPELTDSEKALQQTPLLEQTFTNGHVDAKKRDMRDQVLIVLGSLDENRTGHAKRGDVLRYWESLGVENGCQILRKFGFSDGQCWIDLKQFSWSLDRELVDFVEHEPVILTCVVTLKAELCYLKESFDESRDQATHYFRQLQQLNQRNAFLVEELDQSQQNIEQRSQMQLKEAEERHQSRLNGLESKYRAERDQWRVELRDKDEFLHQLQQKEINLHSRLRQLEKENVKLKEEVDDLSQMMKEMEEMNRELRQALKESSAMRKQQTNDALRKVVPVECGSRAGLVVARSTNNKPIDESECRQCGQLSAKKRLKYTPPSTSALLKRRRLQLQHQTGARSRAHPLDSTDFDSEPEPIFFKPKFKRQLKKKQRWALVANRKSLSNVRDEPDCHEPSTSSDDQQMHSGRLAPPQSTPRTSCSGGRPVNLVGYSCTGKATNSASQFNGSPPGKRFANQVIFSQEFQAELAVMEEQYAQQTRQLLESFETEKQQMRNEIDRELEALLHKASAEKRAALEAQETELKKKFDVHCREIEIKWATERNMIERRFAEEKMEMMSRLQSDFESELKRLRSNGGGSRSGEMGMEQRLKFEQILQENSQLSAQLDGVRRELQDLNQKYSSVQDSKRQLEQKALDMEKDIALGQSLYKEASTSKIVLEADVARLRRDLHEVSLEMLSRQQRIDELTTRRVSNADAIVQTDGKIAQKDEYVQSEQSSFEESSTSLDNVIAYQQALATGVRELDLVLQGVESGFEDGDRSVGDDSSELITVRKLCRGLRNQLAMAQAKLTAQLAADGSKKAADISPNILVEHATQTDRTERSSVDQEMSDDWPDAISDEDKTSASGNASGDTERLMDENFLLRARLLEQKRLTEDLTGQVQLQMRETVKVSTVAQKLYRLCQTLKAADGRSRKQQI